MKLVLRPSFDRLVRRVGIVLSAFGLTFAAASARAEVVTEDLVNPDNPDDIWGQKISGLGETGDEIALVFTKTGETMSWTLPDGVKSAWYLVVGGGGSGGAEYGNYYAAGGGGGAGGMLEEKNALISSPELSVFVGAGGEATTGASNGVNGKSGDDSVLTVNGVKIVAHGGGGGGAARYGANKAAGLKGGSGGGGGRLDTGLGGACYEGEGNVGGSGTGYANHIRGGGGGGGAGGPGDSTTASKGGDGGPGAISAIGGGYVSKYKDDDGNEYYCAGGGGGFASTTTTQNPGLGGKGGGGNGGGTTGVAATNYGCGGGGTKGNGGSATLAKISGAGYQGIVVVRYSTAKQKNPVVLPKINSVKYNGELQKADETDFELDKYDIVNEGGTNAGTYPVTLSLKNPDEYEWFDDHTSTDKTLDFVIEKAENVWTTEPSLSKTAWELDEKPATVNAGEALSEAAVVVTYDEGMTEMPLTVGDHTAVFTVEESQNYTEIEKTIGYKISKNTNIWTSEPGLTKTTWAFDEEPGAVVDGVAKCGDVDVIYDDDRSLVDLPTDRGEHTVKFAVAETDMYTGLEKVVNYTVTKKQHKWTVPPKVPATVNIEDGVSFPMPVAEPGVEVKVYFDNDPEKTELTEIAAGASHTVTYAIEGDDDWDKVEQTFTFKGVYKAIVDPVDPSKVYGYRIPKLGENQDEVALVFTNTIAPIFYTLPQEVAEIDYLVVGGGASGGRSDSGHGAGGGGAGGVVTNEGEVVVSDKEIVVSVGKGGGKPSSGAKGNSGVKSSLTLDGVAIEALPGAGGGVSSAGSGGVSVYACGGGAGNRANGAKSEFLPGGKGVTSDGAGVTTQGSNGGGGGGAGGAATSAVGGVGVAVTIFDDTDYYIAGGGSGTASNWSITDGSLGGGGYGNKYSGGYGTKVDAGPGTRWGAGGGGGGGKDGAAGGAGHQGVVVVRYVEPAGVVMVPTILPKAYTGETLVADVPVNVGYAVTENEGGTDVGDYDVVLTLNDGYHWDGGSTEPTNLTFTITPAQNEWTVEPLITKTTWLTTDDPGELTAGETKFGTPTATISKDGGDAESFDGTLPTAAGQYVITYKVETSDNWIDPEVTEKSVSFEIVSGDVVPPFTVTKGEMTTVVGEGQVDLSVGYAVHCDVESDKTVGIYAYIAEDGADVTNEVKIAEDVALDAVDTGTVPDLKPGVTYWVALGGKGGETVAPMTEFTTVTVAGPATGLAAAATFTNNPKEFIITGSVTPGLGTTTVYVRWSLNSDALDQSQTFAFAFGDTGAFEQKVAYENPTDELTWDVAVSNSYTSTTYGDQTWDDALPVSTKKRTDSVTTIYTWTGAGENNDWANPENWSADKAECFGYPDNEDKAKAKITRTVTINLGGKTFKVVKGEALILDANSGDVVTLTNGTLRAEYDGDGDFGAPGTTVVFRDATLNRTRLNPKDGGMTTIFEGNSRLTGMVRPWNAANAKIIFRNGDISIGGNFGDGSAKTGTEIIISNATVTVQGQATGSWKPGTFPVKLQNGPDRQARIVHTESHGFDFVQSPYTLAIPAEAYATPYLQAVKSGAFITSSPTFNIDVTNWKRGKRVPILTFTSSASGAATQYGGATVKAFENGVDVTTKRNARLIWDEATRTLYYKQDSQGGFALIVK